MGIGTERGVVEGVDEFEGGEAEWNVSTGQRKRGMLEWTPICDPRRFFF